MKPVVVAGRVALVGMLLCSLAAPTLAQQLTENWNTSACGFTDFATLSLERQTNLQRVDIWYRWAADETSVHYSVSQNGAEVAEGDLMRAECDPYQTAWCVARVEPGADLQPGTYVFRTAHARICQNAGSLGRGFIRAFGTSR